MIWIRKIALIFILVVFSVGCSKEAKPEIEGTLAPSWIKKPTVEDAIAEVGSAPKSAAGIGFQRRIALANARSNLAQQVETLVKDKVETFTRTTGIAKAETVDRVATTVSKQVAKVTLRGSKQVDSWRSPSGTFYVLVAIPNKEINAAAKDAVKTSFKNDEALWQQFKSKQAFEELEKEFPTK